MPRQPSSACPSPVCNPRLLKKLHERVASIDECLALHASWARRVNTFDLGDTCLSQARLPGFAQGRVDIQQAGRLTR